VSSVAQAGMSLLVLYFNPSGACAGVIADLHLDDVPFSLLLLHDAASTSSDSN
jgi:hypothetical protein